MEAYWLENTYIAWAKNLEEPAHNEATRFLSGVGSYTKCIASAVVVLTTMSAQFVTDGLRGMHVIARG